MEENKKSIWDFDRIASCSAIFIALLAMVVAVYEARVTRDYQEISVWPSLIQYNSSVPKVADKYMDFGTYIKNNGIGPAVVKKITYKYQGVEYEHLSKIVNLITKKEISKTIQADKMTIKVVLPGEERLLLALDFTEGSDHYAVFQSIASGQISKEFCYCSLYGQC